MKKIVAYVPDLLDRSKVAVGAVVGNDDGEILLVQRADSGVWLYPTGWADVGYSPSEVAVKEVHEETGIEAVPVIAFANHTRRDLMDAAVAAGARQVLARSAFFARLDELLGG